MRKTALILVVLVILTGCAAPAATNIPSPTAIPSPSPSPSPTKELFNMAWVEYELGNIKTMLISQGNNYQLWRRTDFNNVLSNVDFGRMNASLGVSRINLVFDYVQTAIRELEGLKYSMYSFDARNDLDNTLKRLTFVKDRLIEELSATK